MSQIEVLGLVA